MNRLAPSGGIKKSTPQPSDLQNRRAVTTTIPEPSSAVSSPQTTKMEVAPTNSPTPIAGEPTSITNNSSMSNNRGEDQSIKKTFNSFMDLGKDLSPETRKNAKALVVIYLSIVISTQSISRKGK